MKIYGGKYSARDLLNMLQYHESVSNVAKSIDRNISTVWYWLQDIRVRQNEELLSKLDNGMGGKKVLFICDTHFPYVINGYLDFCLSTYEKEGCDTIVMGGDLVDLHSASRHVIDPDLPNSLSELEQSIECCQDFFRAFPKGYLTLGNHDLRIIRKATGSGISREFLKSFEDVYHIPKEWEISESVVIDGIRYQHGNDLSGDNAAVSWTTKNLMSTAIGHIHSSLFVRYYMSPSGIYLAISGGCLADQSSLSMAYSKSFPRRFVNGLTVIENGIYAKSIPFLG